MHASMDGTKRAITMDMCPAELGKHLTLNSERFDPKVRAVIRGSVQQMRHASGPMELDEGAQSADEEYEGKLDGVHLVGRAKGERQDQRKRKAKGTHKC